MSRRDPSLGAHSDRNRPSAISAFSSPASSFKLIELLARVALENECRKRFIWALTFDLSDQVLIAFHFRVVVLFPFSLSLVLPAEGFVPAVAFFVVGDFLNILFQLSAAASGNLFLEPFGGFFQRHALRARPAADFFQFRRRA